MTVAPLVALSRVALLVGWSGFVSVESDEVLVEDSEATSRLLWVRKERSEGTVEVVLVVRDGDEVMVAEPVSEDELIVLLSLALPLGKETLSEVVAVATLDVPFEPRVEVNVTDEDVSFDPTSVVVVGSTEETTEVIEHNKSPLAQDEVVVAPAESVVVAEPVIVPESVVVAEPVADAESVEVVAPPRMLVIVHSSPEQLDVALSVADVSVALPVADPDEASVVVAESVVDAVVVGKLMQSKSVHEDVVSVAVAEPESVVDVSDADAV